MVGRPRLQVHQSQDLRIDCSALVGRSTCLGVVGKNTVDYLGDLAVEDAAADDIAAFDLVDTAVAAAAVVVVAAVGGIDEAEAAIASVAYEDRLA